LEQPVIGKAFLYIFKCVAGLQLRGWPGEDKASANKMNGVIAVSLTQMALINDIYAIMTWFTSLRYPKSYFLPVVLGIFVLWANHRWLITSGRGIAFMRTFDREQASARAEIIFLAVLIAIASIFGIFVLHPRLA
jgi:hypothetical protein